MSTHLHYIFKFKQALLAAFISLSVMSCGGGSSIATAGISGTGIVFGVLTGFGSIFVNGVEYEIDNADFNVDGNTATSQVDLRLGMVLKLNTTLYDDGSIEVDSVNYDDAVEGPVTSVAPDPLDPLNETVKQLVILSLNVIINENTTSFNGTTFNDIMIDDVLEVSGFLRQNGDIVATRVEKVGTLSVGNTIVELRGAISGLDPVQNRFVLNGTTTIHYIDMTTEFEDLNGASDLDSGLASVLNVEVKGKYQADGSINADKIEGEDDDLSEIEDSSGEASLQGLITLLNSTTDFEVNSVPVQVDPSAVIVLDPIISQLELGLEVEVEGIVENGVLIADEVEIREGQLEYEAVIKSVDTVAKTVGLGIPGNTGAIILLVDNTSKLQDETTETDITIDQLSPDDPVKVEARVDDSSNKIVVSLKRITTIEEYEFKDRVTAFEQGVSASIDGLVLPLEGDAALYDFSGVILGETLLEIEDEDLNEIFEKID